MRKYLLIIFLCVICSTTFAQYTPTSPYLLNPELAIGYTDSCAHFWLQTWDNSIGGFFTNIDRYGNIITAWGTNKNMLTQSRNAYGMTRAYMLTGDTTYLGFAKRALNWMYDHAWDETYGGWFQELNINGNPINPTANKTAFYQHYALLGIAAYYEATGDTTATPACPTRRGRTTASSPSSGGSCPEGPRSAPDEPAVEADRLASRRFDRQLPRAVLEDARPTAVRAQGGGREASLLPLDVHLERAPGAETADASRRPGGGEGGEEIDHRRPSVGRAAVGLHQHLRDAGGHAEVAVDLEGRVGVEQVGVDAAAARVARARRVDEPEQVADEAVRVVAVAEARPQVDLPGHRPAGAVVARAAPASAAPPRRARASPWA